MKHLFIALFFALTCCALGVHINDITVEMLPPMFETAIEQTYFTRSFRLVNNGAKPAQLSLQLTVGKSVCRRTIDLAPRSTAIVPLYIPPSKKSIDYFFKFNLAIDGQDIFQEELQELSGAMRIEHISHDKSNILASSTLPLEDYRLLSKAIIDQTAPYLVHNFKFRTSAVSVSQWSTRFRDYVGLDSIWISSEDQVPPDVQAALDTYVRLGGRLYIIVRPQAPLPEGVSEDMPIHQRELGLGMIYTLRPFTPSQQEEAAKIIEARRQKIAKGIPASAKLPPYDSNVVFNILDSAFVKSAPIPLAINLEFVDLEAVPIPMAILFSIMLVFSIIIGPISYFTLQARGKLLLITITTPLISLAFCLLVFLFITFQEGWTSRGKAMGCTLLDQTTGSAVTGAAIGINSPFKPSKGFQFEADDYVYIDNETPVKVLDAPGQLLHKSILKPRVNLSYQVMHAETRHERLQISGYGTDSLTVENGLGAQISTLYVINDDFTIYKAADLQPGAKANLEPTTINSRHSYSLNFPTSTHLLIEPPTLASALPAGYYIAELQTPVFYSPGMTPDKFNVTHIVIGRFQ